MKPIPLEWHKIKAIVFDLDNTLVSSNLNFSALREQMQCPKGIDVLEFADSLPTEALRHHAHAIILDHELSDAKQCKLLPGTPSLLATINEYGLHTAIVTRNCREASDQKLKQHHIRTEVLISREDCKPKPDPEALNLLMQRWQLLPEQLLYVGDYVYDLHTATNAGSPSCLVTNNGLSEEFAPQASITVSTLSELNRIVTRQSK